MQEHGSYNMKIVDQTIIVEAVDAWNLETAERWGIEYKSLVGLIKNLPWACLVDLSNFELAIPDVLEHIDKINEWGNSHNQKFEVVVCSLSIQKDLLQNAHKILTNVETNFCENVVQAKSWLHQKGVLKI